VVSYLLEIQPTDEKKKMRATATAKKLDCGSVWFSYSFFLDVTTRPSNTNHLKLLKKDIMVSTMLLILKYYSLILTGCTW
jgi:hypothetical protein